MDILNSTLLPFTLTDTIRSSIGAAGRRFHCLFRTNDQLAQCNIKLKITLVRTDH